MSLKTKKLTSVLGLSLEGHRLEAVVLKRTNGSVAIQKTCVATLALDPLGSEAELVAQEIRNHLEAAGIRERNCVIGLPSEWAFSLQVKLPALPEEDLKSMLEIEAERGFPYSPDSLLIASAKYQAPGGEEHASLLAIQREHLARLELVLKRARLKPIFYALNVSALSTAPVNPPKGIMTLVLGEVVTLQINYGQGMPALRILEGALEADPGERLIRADVIARECRITLGQLSSDARDAVKEMRIFGETDKVQKLANDLRGPLGVMGISVQAVTRFSADDFGVQIPGDAPVSPAFSLAAKYLAGRSPIFHFTLPKVSQWQLLTSRYSSKKLAWAGGAAAAAAALVLGFFLVQQWQLSQLRSKWGSMSGRVAELEGLQQQIRKYRPWFDDSLRSLSILRRLTEAFPEEGVVTAKNVEIHELASVNCTGSARDSQALLRTLDKLRAAKEVTDVKVDQLRGKTPIEFMFNFHWGERSGDER